MSRGEAHRATVARRTTALREAGLCIRCGKHPATPGPRGGKDHCETCQQRRREWGASQRERHPETYDRNRYRNKTDEQKARHRKLVHDRQVRLQRQGLCRQCGKPARLRRDGKIGGLCQPCTDRNVATAKRKRREDATR